MSQPFIRNLNIHTKDLGTTATLLLTFNDQLLEGIYKDYFPIAWKVTNFNAKGKDSPSSYQYKANSSYAMLATYQNQLCVIKPQITGKVVTASTWIDINLGQQTNLTQKGGVFNFSTPTTGPEKCIQAWNKTNSKQGLGIGKYSIDIVATILISKNCIAGFDNASSYPPATALYFPDIGVDYDVTAKFNPVLKAYIVTSYLENEVLRGAVATPAIWSRDLTELDTNTSLTLSYESSSGSFLLQEDNAATALIQQPGGAGLIDEDLARIVKLLKDLLGEAGMEKFLKGKENLGILSNGSGGNV